MDGMFRESVRDRVESELRSRRVQKKQSKLTRFRNKMNTVLHTHVALIVLVVLVTLDASCVIGQILCDILIIQDKLWDSEHAAEDLVEVLQDRFPDELNHTDKHFTLTQILEILKKGMNKTDSHDAHGHGDTVTKSVLAATLLPTTLPSTLPTTMDTILEATTGIPGRVRRSFDETLDFLNGAPESSQKVHSRVRRASADGHGEHSLLEELTHIFHLGSLAILSFLVFVVSILRSSGYYSTNEVLTHIFHLGSLAILSFLVFVTVLKIFAMGKKFLHHKLEMFDSFVVTVSWALDLAFLQGIWAKPGPDAATILLFLLPWRVVRIVNSFVMVIEEREHVKLKLLKLKLRTGDKKITSLKLTIERYRMEGRNLQGLCRKHGAPEAEISACAPQWKRRRSSLVSLMENCAKLAFAGAMSSQPSDIHKKGEESDISDDEDAVNTHTPRRITSTDSGVSSVSINSAGDFTNGKDNPVFMLDNGSSEGISRRDSVTSFGRRSSLASFGRRDSTASWNDYSYP